ncbi:unnamed protein product [Dicrocoelium dendriticum]|nr:unnamed protein product [Dicrocoelium dendriticum]CAH8657435.1 unnamed protein product [Dicrocoelium dendriticum]
MAASLCKFSVIHRDLANMSKHLMQNLNSILVFPLETFMQGDAKADLKKPFEKALREYEWKYDKLRKEKVQLMKETGIFTPEAFTAEMIEDLEKERRKLQLETCEYLIKVGELKAKRSADLLQHLIDFYYAQNHCLRECLGVMDHFGKSMNELTARVGALQKSHDTQRRRLLDTREEIRFLLEKDSSQSGVTYAAPPAQTNRSYGTRKSGFLLKKSDGKVKRVWQRRKVRIGDGELCLYHADETKPPVRLALLTCQIKLPFESTGQQPETSDISAVAHPISELRNHFDLISNSRTYNFQAEDDQEFEEWIHVLNNALQEEFQRALNSNDSSVSTLPNCLPNNRNNSNSNIPFEVDPRHGSSRSRPPLNSALQRIESGSGGGGSISGDSLPGSDNYLLDHSSPTSFSQDSRLSRLGSADILAVGGTALTTADTSEHLTGKSLRHFVQSSLRSHPGNEICADCGRPDPEWVSVNLGVLICLECCGAHRELGVHCSRTQSLMMDELSTSQLLIPRFVGNRLFNEVFESSLASGVKPKAADNVTDGSNMLQRRSFIKAKYVNRKFVTSTTRVFRTDSSTSLPNGEEQRHSNIEDTLSERFLRRDLLRAVKQRDLAALLQVFAERFNLMTPFHPEDDDDGTFGQISGMTALHVAVQCRSINELSSPLPLIEFILQNSPFSHIQRTNSRGETALHHAMRCGSADALKLLLQAGGLPTPMLHLRNNDGQTALKLGEDLLEEKSVLNGNLLTDYENCTHLLRMAEHVASTSSNAEQPDPLFSGSDAVERSLASRSTLQKVVDELNSVNWLTAPPPFLSALHGRTDSPGGNPSLSTATTEPMGSRISTTAKKLFGHNTKEPSDTYKLTVNVGDQVDSCFNRLFSGGTMATLPRKKGPAPLPPPTDPMGLEIPFESPHWTSKSARNAYFSCTPKTTFTLLTSTDRAQLTGTPSARTSHTHVPASPSKAKEVLFPLQQEDASSLRDMSRERLSKPTDTRPKSITSSTASHLDTADKTVDKQSCRRVYHSNEHIDVLLDVLEEKPLVESSAAPVSSDSISGQSPPPIPPKPQVPSALLCSTFPSRGSSRSNPQESSPVDRIDSPDPKQTKPVLPVTPRSSRFSLLGNKKLSRALSTPTSQDIDSVQSNASVADPRSAQSETPLVPSELGTLFEALYDCEAGRADELTFRRGEIIQLTARSEDEWWEGCIQHEPWRRGFFPITYVRCASSRMHGPT